MDTIEPMGAGGRGRVNDASVLVTGGTGYVGGRLVPRLLEAGYRVRCLARSAPKLAARPWASDPRVEVVEADLADAEATEAAMRGCQAAYYLVHSMVASGASYAEADHRLAERFALAAARARVGRIINLGGLGEQGEGLSEHLSSRREVEAVLAAGSVPVTVLRAAMITTGTRSCHCTPSCSAGCSRASAEPPPARPPQILAPADEPHARKRSRSALLLCM